MFGIVEDLPPPCLQVRDALPDHREIFRVGNPEHLLDLKLPALAENGDHGSPGKEKLLDLRVILHPDSGTTGAAEGC